jgi:HlyD family secretion protein
MKKKTLFILIAIIGVGAIIVGYTLFQRNGNNRIEYQTAKIERGELKQVVMATGSLSPVTEVEVGSQVSGRIAKLYADFNSQVKEGAVVAEIEQSVFISRMKQSEASHAMAEASLNKAEVNLRTMERNYKRSIELFEKGMVSEQERDAAEDAYLSARADLSSAKARLAEAKASLDSARVDLEHTVITSPIDGMVISRNVNVGQTVAASFQAPVLFVIVNDLARMQVTCNVDEADIGKVKEEQRASFVVDAHPDDIFQGKVVQVRFNPVEVQNVITYDAIIEVENPELKLKPGMTATVSIITAERKDVLLIPNKAIDFRPPNFSPEKMREVSAAQFTGTGEADSRNRGGESERKPPSRQGGESGNSRIIWLLKEGKLVATPVVIGVSNDSHTEVIRGRIEPGDLVVVAVKGGSMANQGSQERGPSSPPGMRFIRR